MKRRLKQEQKAKEKVEKDRQKAEAAPAAASANHVGDKAKKPAKQSEEEISPNVR